MCMGVGVGVGNVSAGGKESRTKCELLHTKDGGSKCGV